METNLHNPKASERHSLLRRCLPSLGAALLGLTGAFSANATPPGSQVSFTTPGATTWTVPANVTSVQIVAIGGGGGGGNGNSPSTLTNSPGGNGGKVTATLAVTSGQVLNLKVGGGGGTNLGGGGGSSTSVNVGSSDQIIAGGGGGGGNGSNSPGGDGNGGNGTGFVNDLGGIGAGSGTGGAGGVGTGMTGTSGTSSNGGDGAGGNGYVSGDGGGGYWAGGGGGGWGGGGGGGWSGSGTGGGGGGGGGSLGPAGAALSLGANGGASFVDGGNGSITITYTQPLAPDTPAAPTATPGNASANVTFAAPANNGSAIIGYTVVSNPAGGVDSNAGSTALTHTMTGLTNGTAYTFTVTATNGVGTSGASPASNSVTPAGTPTTPASPTATAGNTTANVTFAAPANNGSAIIGYTVVSNPAGGVDSNAGSTALTHTMTGLTNGTAYTFTVTATNGVGTSGTSPASNSVTPTESVVPPPIPNNVALPGVSGIGSQLTVLDLTSGSGPSMTTCLVDAVKQLFGADATYVGQSANGAAQILVGGQTVSYYPLEASTGTGLGVGAFLRNDNAVTMGTNCGTFSVAPAVANMADLGRALAALGLRVQVDAKGVFTATVDNQLYVVRPDYFVTQGTATGTPSLAFGADGVLRFTDSAGKVQILQPAFLDLTGLQSAIVTTLGQYGYLVIQTDGSGVFTRFDGSQLVLAPEMVLSLAPNGFGSTKVVNDQPGHYQYLVGTYYQGVTATVR